VTRPDAELAVRHFCGVWRLKRGLSDDSEKELIFDDFFAWMQRNAPNALGFAAQVSIRQDVEAWFDDEFRRK